MAFKNIKSTESSALGIKGKLRLSFGAIIMLLILTICVSAIEFRRMSTYVSDRISENITTINLSTELAMLIDEYNLQILSVVGKADEITKSNIDTTAVSEKSSAIFEKLQGQMYVYVDGVKASCKKYYNTSRQLDSIIVNDFVDTREWYFTVLQPDYDVFRKDMEEFNRRNYDALRKNSTNFDESFYRGIIPSFVSASAVILLCVLLQFFIITFYVKPLRRMLKGMDAYRNSNMNYVHVFDGDDELQALNNGITEIIEENISLKKRLNSLNREF